MTGVGGPWYGYCMSTTTKAEVWTEESESWTPTFPADAVLTIEVSEGRPHSKVTEWIFRSWTGRRFIDGVEFTGTVFFLGSDKEAK